MFGKKPFQRNDEIGNAVGPRDKIRRAKPLSASPHHFWPSFSVPMLRLSVLLISLIVGGTGALSTTAVRIVRPLAISPAKPSVAHPVAAIENSANIPAKLPSAPVCGVRSAGTQEKSGDRPPP